MSVQTPSTCECDLIWKWNLWICYQVKMRLLDQVGSNPMTGVYKRNLNTDIQSGKGLVRQRHSQTEDGHTKTEV